MEVEARGCKIETVCEFRFKDQHQRTVRNQAPSRDRATERGMLAGPGLADAQL